MNSKRKGCRGERELAELFTAHGFPARRGQQFKGGVDSPDVVGVPGVHPEVKRVEKLNIYESLAQAIRDAAGKKPAAVFHRRNYNAKAPINGWMVTMAFDDWMTVALPYLLMHMEQEESDEIR